MSGRSWGTKRTCQGCGIRFYDLGRVPAVCPRCSRKFDPDAPIKAKRGRAAGARKKAAEKKKKDGIKEIAKLVEKTRIAPGEEESVVIKGAANAIEAMEEIEEGDDIRGIVELEDINSDKNDDSDERIIEDMDIQGSSLIDKEGDE